jgi:hypothetical protein
VASLRSRVFHRRRLPRQTSLGVPAGIGSPAPRGLLIPGSIARSRSAPRAPPRRSRGRPRARPDGCWPRRARRAAGSGGAARSRCRREPEASGRPSASTARWRRLPALPRSVRATFSPPFLRSTSEASTITRDQSSCWPRPAARAGRGSPVEEAAPRPFLEPAAAGLAARQAELAVGHLQPGRVGVEHVEDPLQALAGAVAGAPG